MARAVRDQFNIRSAYARRRAHEIAHQTGMTASQVVEEALRAYAPSTPGQIGGLVRKGKLLVLPATGPTVSAKEVEQALDALREELR